MGASLHGVCVQRRCCRPHTRTMIRRMSNVEQQQCPSPLSPSIQRITLVSVTLLILALHGADAFVPSHHGSVQARIPLYRCDFIHCSAECTCTIMFANKERRTGRTTPSSTRSRRSINKTPVSQRNESRFGVRSRVKSVLKKAKKRTGVRNSSEKSVDRMDTGFQARGDQVMEDVAVPEAAKEDLRGNLNIDTQFSQQVSGEEQTSSESIEQQIRFEEFRLLVDAEKEGDNNTIANETASVERQREAVSLQSNSNDESLSKGMDEETSVNKREESIPSDPLPFTLPEITADQQRQLDVGERVQFQNDMGREGSGFVVLDVKAPPDVVWKCLLDFSSYPSTIPTVRDVTMYTNTHLSGDYRSERPLAFEQDGSVATLEPGVPSVTRAAFTLSKFRLKIAAIHKYTPNPVGDYMIFTLDPACTNLVLKSAKGVWHTQSNPDGKGEDYTRVWLLCEVRVSRLFPQWITDYAARRAMPRATTWLKPQVEAANVLWLNNKGRNAR